ncbi:MAG: BrnT family toxin [Candidatus Thiodiazotropha sp. 6PLUC9]
MSELEFTWDKAKDVKNHGICFDEAKTVFYDDRARLITDPDYSEDEDRYILLGLCSQLRILIVCHYYREDGRAIKNISAHYCPAYFNHMKRFAYTLSPTPLP